MKDENQPEGLRKSHRQRVPNSFYTEGINELKKQTRVVKEPVKPVRKRSRGYEEQEEISFVGDQEEARSEQRDSNNWYPCVLPTNRVNVKVQFVLNVPEEVVPQVKKAEPAAPKTTKKSDPTTDLLSLFQKAIENVNEPEVPSRPTQQELGRQTRGRPVPPPKQRRPEDPQGKITSIERLPDKLLLNHSKLGEIQISMQGSESSSSSGESIDLELVEEYREKLLNSQHFLKLSLFH